MEREYKCDPLNLQAREIRLLTLESGDWPDPISCKVDIVPFDSHPFYEALSYVWGDPGIQQTIQVNNHPYKVTENLWMVLRRLRDSSATRVLWIDAICINQEDNAEKSHQVAMMGEIYRRCDKAVIWLGEDATNIGTGSKSAVASQACEMLEILGADRHLNELPCFSASQGQRTEISDTYLVHFDALREFVHLQWWQRIWVIQEMVLPKQLQFLYSSEEFTYERLKSVVEGLQKHGTTCCKQYRYSLRAHAFDPILTLQEQVEPMVYTRETWNDETLLTLSSLRRQFSASRATQRRDLFYALLGLVTSWSSTTPLYPDYSVSDKEAITQAVFKCVVSEEGKLETLLGERGSWNREARDTEVVMPTWIPDSSFMTVPSQWVIVQQRRLRISSGFAASASLRQDTAKLSLADDGHLICQTLRVGKVTEVGPVSEALDNFEQAPDIFRQWLEMVNIGVQDWPEAPPPEGSQNDIFWKTMIYGSVELDTDNAPFYRRPDANDYVQLRNFWILVTGPFGNFIAGQLSLSIKSHDDLMAMAPDLLYHVFVCIWRRRLFRTDSGWIGLASRQTAPGDEVHILLGSRIPFILRRGNESFKVGKAGAVPEYSVVGDAYVHNIMFGGAFAGGREKDVEVIALR